MDSLGHQRDLKHVSDVNLFLQDLMKRIEDEDREAFSVFYSTSADRVYSLAVKVLRNHALAEEVVQEIYLQVWKDPCSYDPAKGKVFTWLLTLCHRRSVDKVRHEQSRKNQEEKFIRRDENGASADLCEDVANRVDATMIHENLENLSPKQNEILKLVYFDSKTINEAAEHLEIPLPTAKTRLRDGLKKLRKDLRSELK